MASSAILRQLLVVTALQLAALAVGAAVSYPAILLQHLTSTDEGILLDLNMASWIGSIHGLAGLPTVFIPMFMQWKGRRLAFIAACTVSITGWIITYIASSALEILVSELLQGLGTHFILVVGLSSIAEMVAPKYRNISLVSYYILEMLGMFVVGVLGKYVHWKTISIIISIVLVLAFIIACTWPESPYWLAYIGEYDKCEQAFVWLRGTDVESKRELTDLLLMSKEKQDTKKDKNAFLFFKTMRQRDFYLPVFFIFILLNGVYWSGTLVAIIYVGDILTKITNNTTLIANSSVITNTIFFFGAIGVNILNKFFQYKTIILLNVSLTIVSTTTTSILIYLQSFSVISKDSLLPASSLLFFIVIMSFGTNSFTVAAELMPVKHKGFGGALYMIFTCLLHLTSLKISPYLFMYVGLSGTFLIYAANSTVCGYVVWRYVPETKGRTLQEIEDYYENLSFKKRCTDLEVEADLLH